MAPVSPASSPLVGIIIDDSLAVCQTLEAMLHRQGVEEVLTTGDGASGLALLDSLQDRSCVVFCDLAMPGMDGVEVVREIHRREFRAAIVLVSGKDPRVLDVVSKLAQDSGHPVVGVMSKPFVESDVARLMAKVRDQPATPVPAEARPDMLNPEAIRAGIEEDRVAVVMEPQIRLSDGRPMAMEALMRIDSPDGMILPYSFINVAEQHGLMEALTQQLLDKLFHQVSVWSRHGIQLGVSINLSPSLLIEPSMPNRIRDAASRAGISAESIMIELTESAAADCGIDDIIQSVARFRLQDFRIAIDDFGTGQSSLERLQRIPFTDLKIDRAFVTGASNNNHNRGIVEYSVQLAHRLGLNVIAEGVETQDDEEQVRSLGCEMAQGYYYTRPLSLDRVPGWLHNWEEQADERIHSKEDIHDAGN